MDDEMHVSPETIYMHLYLMVRGQLRRELLGHLRGKRTLSRATRGVTRPNGWRADLPLIVDRPDEVDGREVPGHWEADLVVGPGSAALGVMLERTTRACVLVPLQRRDATTTRTEFTKALLEVPDHLRKTFTYDQGTEMVQYQQLARDTSLEVFFCHPHSPWEKGGVENLNGLIRQYFPKGTNFATVTPEQVRQVQDKLNRRPRRVLDYDTPGQKLTQLLAGGDVALEG